MAAVNVSTLISYQNVNGNSYSIQDTDVVCGSAQGGDSGGPVIDGTYTNAMIGDILADGTSSYCSGGPVFIVERAVEFLSLFGGYVP
jgi:hypothetical protein